MYIPVEKLTSGAWFKIHHPFALAQSMLHHAVQGHLKIATVLDAARLAGPRGLAAALDSIGASLIKGVEPSALVDGEPDHVPYNELPKMRELVVEWAAGVLAERRATSAGACGARQGAPAPARKPSFPRTDAWASEAWPGLADVIVTLVLRSAITC